MSKFVPRSRDGKSIKNYRKRHEFILPGNSSGVKVPSPATGDLEKALKVFKRQMKDSGKLLEYKSRKEHIKKSEKNKIKMEKAIREQKKRDRFNSRSNRGVWTAIIDGKAQ